MRPIVISLAMLTVYLTLPWDQTIGVIALGLVLGLAVLARLLVRQIRAIRGSPLPALRGVEIATTTLTAFLLLFAGAYFATEEFIAGSFSEPLTRLDAIYFVLTIFTTLGFGDIVPVTTGARVLVILQMLFDLLFIGVVAKVLVQAVRSAESLPPTPADE